MEVLEKLVSYRVGTALAFLRSVRMLEIQTWVTTFPPGASMIEWMVGCEGRFSWEKDGLTTITYDNVYPKAHNLCGVFDILLFRLLRFTDRSGVGDTTVVLVQVFCDEAHVPLSKFLTK